jgi:hypothetical protein
MKLEDENPTSSVQFVNCTLATPKYADTIFGADGRVTALYLASLSTALAHAVAAVLGDFFQMKHVYGEQRYRDTYRDKVLRTSSICDRWKWSELDAEAERTLRRLKVLQDVVSTNHSSGCSGSCKSAYINLALFSSQLVFLLLV